MKNYRLLLHMMVLSIACLTLSSCQKDFDETLSSSVRVDSVRSGHLSLTKGGTVKKGLFRGRPITYQEMDDQPVFQGDILLSKDDLNSYKENVGGTNSRTSGIGLANDYRRWKNGVVPYVFADSPYWDKIRMKNAMAYWEDKTPIRFIPRTNDEFDYIQFEWSNATRSFVGRQGGKQVIEISTTALGPIVHELGHALGLVHEHMRSDKSDYINFYPQNLEKGFNPTNWFAVSNMPEDIGFDNYRGFDFTSVMLYGSYDGAETNSDGTYVGPVFTKKDGSVFEGNSLHEIPSFGDKETVRAMYSYVYLVRGDVLSAVTTEGQLAKLANGWRGAAQSIAEDGRYIWGIHHGKLWKTDRLTGFFQTVGNGNWDAAIGVTGVDSQGNFYAQAGDYLWKIDKYGVHRALGAAGWKGTKALYYLNGFLYVIWQNPYLVTPPILYKVDATTGAYNRLGVQTFSNFQAMTSLNFTAKELYMIDGGNLLKINVNTGESSMIKLGGFKNTTAMTAYGDYLYVVSDEKLFKSDLSGKKTQLPGVMDGVTSMGATRFLGL